MSTASKPAKQNGTSSAETIRASGQRPREQAGHKTAPDQHARPSQTPCNAGAIHTGHVVKLVLGQPEGTNLCGAQMGGTNDWDLLQSEQAGSFPPSVARNDNVL